MSITLDDLIPYAEGARQYSDYFVALCPFHDDTKASLLVSNKGYYKCMACDATGSLGQLMEVYQGYSPRRVHVEHTQSYPPRLPKLTDALDDLCYSANRILIDKVGLRWYLEQRGLEGRIETCRLGWYNGWYTIPVYSEDKSFQGMVMRASSQQQDVTGLRFTMPKRQLPMLYVPEWQLLRNAPTLFVTFGLFDALALTELRFAACTTTGGMKSFSGEWLNFWRKPIYIVPDRGEDTTARELALELGVRARVLNLPYPDSMKDPADYLEAHRGKDLYTLLAPYYMERKSRYAELSSLHEQEGGVHLRAS